MPQLYLPADHSDADLALAGQVAELLESAELYVTWTQEAGHAAPAIPALLRDAEPTWAEAVGELLYAVRALWRAVTSRRRPRSERQLLLWRERSPGRPRRGTTA
jgi:hypothetical protein